VNHKIKILSILGKGATAEVFKIAMKKEKDEIYAMKIFDKETFKSEKKIAMVYEEIKV
jgi:hypothetical protein